ncbi:MAG: oxidoreductase, partial [Nocardioidaceae bacterium]|nr:oxidoreductase [Nocardioidaceae bacterium]
MPTNSSGPIRWGILATGSISRKFATDLREVGDAVLQAVGSRRLDAAHAFADEFGATSAYGSYEELAADPEVDVIYVATPHGRHVEDVMTCFAAGKPVLCEKPIALNADQTAALIAEAKARGLFFAEAMWMRANPNIIAAKKVVDDGTIGAPVQLRATLGYRARAEKNRLWDLELGASALLDAGIYPLTLAYVMLGAPETVVAAGVVSTGST